MADEDKPILTTIKEAKMAIGILTLLSQKREKFGEDKTWLYISETIRALKDFPAMTIRSFLEKLEENKVIEFIPPPEWGGVFRYTKSGEQRIKKELSELSIKS